MTKAGEFLSGVLGLLGLSEPLSPNPCSEGLGLQPYGRMPYYAAPVDSLYLWEDIRPWVEGAAAAAFRAKGAKGKTARG